MAVTIHNKPSSSYKFSRYTITISSTHTISTTVGAARDWIYSTLYHHRRNRHRLVIGLGVQWNSYTIANIDSPAATIQLCIGSHCLIFHLCHSLSSPRILLDPRITFVGLSNQIDDVKLLQSHHRLLMVKGMPIDLRNYVFDSHGRSLQHASISEIAAQVLKIDIEWDHHTSMSDWEYVELSLPQVLQAALDAFLAFAIGMNVQAWNLNNNL